uniref:Small ribosomal subunit protein uS4c n=1 Tax=Vaginularia trichoidea TaxID=474354 RepID=A0A3G5CTQ2_9MONI|nr:ribosomal protein S4 [Vaginularia trichoidea]AYW16076.1 ribosomal protein S4 [Vaginularia trichoidea]
MRRLRDLPGLAGKKNTGPNTTESQVTNDQLASNKISQFCVRLEAKQRLRLNYGLTEHQLIRYVRLARKTKGSTGQVPLQLLEMRLDNVIFQLGMAPTIPTARQLVNHRHILLNNQIVDRPSYRCKPGDIITVRNRLTCWNAARDSSSEKDKIPNHLTLSVSNTGQSTGLVNHMVNRESVGLEINELFVVEYYSRKA